MSPAPIFGAPSLSICGLHGDDDEEGENGHNEKYFSDLLAAFRSKLNPKLPPIPDSVRSAFLSCCSSVVAARSARDAALRAKDAADKAGDDSSKEAAKNALDAAEDALKKADIATVDCARPILDALKDGLLETDALDPLLCKGAVLFNGTPKGLADFCAGGDGQDRLIMDLLDDTTLMRRMLEAGGAKGGEYGGAARIYKGIKDGNAREWVHVDAGGENDEDRTADDALEHLALGTSLEHAVPVAEFRSDGKLFVDPVSRYRHYADAYRNGELDESFSDRTAWEMRLVSNCDAPDDQLAWGRQMLRTYRPDLVRLEDMKWRYCNIVHTDVVYTHPPFDEKTYQDIISGGGECGPRAWFGRYACRCFGIPVWGCKQPGHAAMTHWTPDQGWVVCLIYGGFWDIAWWEDRCGDDFLLETQARDSGSGDYMSVLRLEWVADVLGEQNLDRMKVLVDPNSFWRSLALCKKKILANGRGKCVAAFLDSTVEGEEISTRSQIVQRCGSEQQAIAYKEDGTIIIPATSCSKPTAPTQNVLFMDSFSGGTQLHHRADAIVEYILKDVTEAGTYAVSFQVCSVHSVEQPILLTVCPNNGDLPTSVASIIVPYTVGEWALTDPVKVELAEGANAVSFLRETPNFGLSIKEITFEKVCAA